MYLWFLLTLGWCLQAAPVLLASHRVVPRLKHELQLPETDVQSLHDVTNMLRRLVTECLLDIYLLVNVPGLEHSDLIDAKHHLWPNLLRYLHMASTVVAVPWMEDTLELRYLETYIQKTCKADAAHVASLDDVADYIDTRTRVFRLEHNPLPVGAGRDECLKRVDESIRDMLRKAPSPHYTILVTSDVPLAVHPLPAGALDDMPDYFIPFYGIVGDPRRAADTERNQHMYGNAEPVWHEKRDPTAAYLERRQQDEVHLFSYTLWKKHQRLVTTVLLMALSLLCFTTLSQKSKRD